MPIGRLCRAVLVEVVNNRAGLVHIPRGNDDLHGSRTASRSSLGRNHTDKLILQQRTDAFSSKHLSRSAWTMVPEYMMVKSEFGIGCLYIKGTTETTKGGTVRLGY